LRSAHDVASWLDDCDSFRTGMAAIHDGATTLTDAIEIKLSNVGHLQAT
jgi:hypothetical protein